MMWQEEEKLSPWAISKPGRFGLPGHIEYGVEAPNQRSLYLQVYHSDVSSIVSRYDANSAPTVADHSISSSRILSPRLPGVSFALIGFPTVPLLLQCKQRAVTLNLNPQLGHDW
eukprot:COSAG01_NODE_1997_length_8691_cov_5.509777_3_plen_114_part_00